MKWLTMEYREILRRNICWIIDNREGGSPAAFGKKIGRIRQRVNSWKKGESSPDLDTVGEIARVYGLSLDWLIGGDESKAQTECVHLSASTHNRR